MRRAPLPYDREYATLMPPVRTTERRGCLHDFDWSKAIALGAKAAGLPYSGRFGWARTSMHWPLSHAVAPKEGALRNPKRLPWTAHAHGLGGARLRGRSPPERSPAMRPRAIRFAALAALLVLFATPSHAANAMHPTFAVLDGAGVPASRSGHSASSKRTCGACHDAAYIAAHTDTGTSA